MQLFKNLNFVAQLVRLQGAGDHFDKETLLLLLSLVELETRKLVETSARFTRMERRDVMTQEDLEEALQVLGHEDIHFSSEPRHYSKEGMQLLLKDPIYTSPTDYIAEKSRYFGSVIEAPKLRARWVYIQGQIPKTRHNKQLKSLADLRNIRSHEQEQKKKLFNIIRDEPQSLYTKEELEYFHEVKTLLTSSERNVKIGPVKGNVSSLVPMLLSSITIELTDNSVQYLIRLLENKYVWEGIQSHLHQVLAILVAYQGPISQQVGLAISRIVQAFSSKCPTLNDIFVGSERNYSNTIKQIMLEVTNGIQADLDESYIVLCKEDAQQNHEIAVICFQKIVCFWHELSALRTVKKPSRFGRLYWHPCEANHDEPFMMMF